MNRHNPQIHPPPGSAFRIAQAQWPALPDLNRWAGKSTVPKPYAFTGTPLYGRKVPLRDAPVSSIELSWYTRRRITAPNLCSQVLHTLRKARDGGPVHACPTLGSLTVRYSDGTTNGFALMPGHRINRLDLVDMSGPGLYSISMSEMRHTLESVGLLEKDQK